jgi:hypothetical protein
VDVAMLKYLNSYIPYLSSQYDLSKNHQIMLGSRGLRATLRISPLATTSEIKEKA